MHKTIKNKNTGDSPAYLVVQSLHAGYSLCLLERVDLNAMLVCYGFELLVNVVEHLTVNLERLDDLLVRI